MGHDPSIDWSSVSGGYDEAVGSSEAAVAEAEANQTYWKNQDVLWASMYGDMESNVANYYDSLTAEGVTAERNQQTTAQITAAKERTLQQLQDRGITSSGMTAQVIANSNSSEAIMLANNAYTANKDIWQQKTAFMQGIALPQKQQTQAGMSAASRGVSTAYGNLSQAEFNRAGAQLSVEQFNEQNKNAQLNQAMGMVGALGGAYLGGGMGAAPSSGGYSAPAAAPQTFQFDTMPLEYDVIPTSERIV